MGKRVMAGQGSRGIAPAGREAIDQSRRFTDDTRRDSRPGNGSRQDGTSDRLSGTPTHRDQVQQLARLYCELGTATFDHADGRLLSQQYQQRRHALCAAIRRQLQQVAQANGRETR